jgi:hypothetical protein
MKDTISFHIDEKEHKREIEIWDRTPKLAVKHKTTGYGERRWKQEPPRRAVCRLAALHVHGFCAVATVIRLLMRRQAAVPHWQRTLACLIARAPARPESPRTTRRCQVVPETQPPFSPMGQTIQCTVHAGGQWSSGQCGHTGSELARQSTTGDP